MWLLFFVLLTVVNRFIALRSAESGQLPPGFAMDAGNQWADRARYILFTNMNNVSVETTMVPAYSSPRYKL